ncbi:hypothetical protein [Ruminococcus sp. JL13D9]|uniref:hypothetical protein n=1 Tax=Ruminococcus sp. JL13D9 TaxID=3233381 RepID=UPI003899B0F4
MVIDDDDYKKTSELHELYYNRSSCPIVSDERITQLSETELADLFSEVSNKSSMYMHMVDEDPKYKAIFQSYYTLYIKLKDRILWVLKKTNNGDIKSKPYHDAVKPFMESNGYRDGRGWWIKMD